MRRLALGGVTVAACLPVLLGCSSGTASTPPPTTPHTHPTTASPSTSSSPSPTPTQPTGPTPPTFPAAARHESIAGAKAFVRYYISAINYSWHVRNGALPRRFSVLQCVSCRGLANSIDKIGENGGYSRGGDWIVTSASPVPLQRLTAPIIHISVTGRAGKWKRSRDDRVRLIKPEKLYVDVHLTWRSQRWLVTSMVPA